MPVGHGSLPAPPNDRRAVALRDRIVLDTCSTCRRSNPRATRGCPWGLIARSRRHRCAGAPSTTLPLDTRHQWVPVHAGRGGRAHRAASAGTSRAAISLLTREASTLSSGAPGSANSTCPGSGLSAAVATTVRPFGVFSVRPPYPGGFSHDWGWEWMIELRSWVRGGSRRAPSLTEE